MPSKQRAFLLETEEVDYNNLMASLAKYRKDPQTISNYHEEFNNLDRKIRQSQIGNIQKDKLLGKKGNKELVRAVRVPIPIAKKIVNTSVAFEFGKPVNLSSKEENTLSGQIIEQWKLLRIDHKIKQAKVLQKQETHSALLFHFRDSKEGKEMKCKVLSFNKSGEFYPFFDAMGDMTRFVNRFVTYDENLKEKECAWIYDSNEVTQLKKDGSKWTIEDKASHGFDRIPVVYFNQEHPEHYDVADMIDRLEVAQSKLGASNDYTGHPLLFLEGEVTGLPHKDADGKALKTKVEYNSDGHKIKGGDAKFLTHDNAPDSVKLEIEKLEDYIYSMSSTPNISFSNLKSVGNISGKALELMFLDSTLKKLMNEGQNRIDVERILSVIASGIYTTSQVSLKSQKNSVDIGIEFGNVLPNSWDEVAETLATLISNNLISRDLAVSILGSAEDIDEELQKIAKQSTQEEPVT